MDEHTDEHDEVELCSAQTYMGSLEQPPEYCEEEAEPGEEFCAYHLDPGPDPDVERDRLIDEGLM